MILQRFLLGTEPRGNPVPILQEQLIFLIPARNIPRKDSKHTPHKHRIGQYHQRKKLSHPGNRRQQHVNNQAADHQLISAIPPIHCSSDSFQQSRSPLFYRDNTKSVFYSVYNNIERQNLCQGQTRSIYILYLFKECCFHLCNKSEPFRCLSPHLAPKSSFLYLEGNRFITRGYFPFSVKRILRIVMKNLRFIYWI